MTTKRSYYAALFLFIITFMLQALQYKAGLRLSIDVTMPERPTKTTTMREEDYTCDWRYVIDPNTTRAKPVTTEPGYVPAGSAECEWCVTWGGASRDSVSGITASADRIFVCGNTENKTNALGNITKSGWSYPCGYVACYSTSGTLLWARAVGGNGYVFIQDICLLSDGSVAVVGYTVANNLIVESTPAGDRSDICAFAVNWSSTGTELSRKVFSGNGYDILNCCAPLPDGGLVAGGSTTSSNGDFSFATGASCAVIMKLDSSFNVDDGVAYTGSNGGAFYGLDTDTDGNIYATCTTISSDGDFGLAGAGRGMNDCIVYKFSSSLTKQWSCMVAGSGEDNFKSVINSGRGGCVVVGCYTPANSSAVPDGTFKGLTMCGDTDGVLVFIGPAGSVTNKKLIGGLNDDKPCAVTRKGTDYYVTGYTYSSNRTFVPIGNLGGSDAFIMKFDYTGDMTNLYTVSGTGDDSASKICATADSVFVAGITSSNDEFFLLGRPPASNPCTPFAVRYDF